MVTYDRDHVEGQSYQISERPLDLSFFAKLAASPKPVSYTHLTLPTILLV